MQCIPRLRGHFASRARRVECPVASGTQEEVLRRPRKTGKYWQFAVINRLWNIVPGGALIARSHPPPSRPRPLSCTSPEWMEGCSARRWMGGPCLGAFVSVGNRIKAPARETSPVCVLHLTRFWCPARSISPLAPNTPRLLFMDWPMSDLDSTSLSVIFTLFVCSVPGKVVTV